MTWSGVRPAADIMPSKFITRFQELGQPRRLETRRSKFTLRQNWMQHIPGNIRQTVAAAVVEIR